MSTSPRYHAVLEWLDFDYSSFFSQTWPDLGLSDENLRALELELLKNPVRPPVESGTGGLRKIRVARPGMGKSGGARVGYAHFPKHGVILMITVFAKNDQATLTPQQKKAVKQTLARYEAHLETLRRRSPEQIAALRAAAEKHRRRSQHGQE